MKKKWFFIAVCLTEFASSFANSIQGVLLTNYINYYKLESVNRGLMGTFQSIGCIAICLAIIFTAGRIKRYKMLLFTCVTLFVPVILISLKPSFIVLLLLYFIIGLGFASASNIASSLSASLYPGSSVAMGLVHAFFGAGGLLAPIVLKAALAKMEWNMVCLVDGAVIFAVLIIYFVTVFASKDITSQIPEASNRIALRDVGFFLKKGRNILLIIAGFGYMAFQQGLAVWIARYSDIQLDITGYGALILSTFWIGNTVSRLTVPHIKLRTEVLFSVGCLIASAVVAVGIIVNSTVLMFICMAICGIVSGASTPEIYLLGSVWNEGSSLLPTSVLGISLFASMMITSPITAAFTQNGIVYGMFAIVAYGVIAGASLLPVVIKRKKE